MCCSAISLLVLARFGVVLTVNLDKDRTLHVYGIITVKEKNSPLKRAAWTLFFATRENPKVLNEWRTYSIYAPCCPIQRPANAGHRCGSCGSSTCDDSCRDLQIAKANVRVSAQLVFGYSRISAQPTEIGMHRGITLVVGFSDPNYTKCHSQN